ncbi:MFS transporter [Novosphingobium profundi]|uniref:MFS transporter n=1 Tax=Novosphingobium profundi TaxID=1774954 RepID=UPI001FE8F470|nr:MFS transporter [Novosphingobium profundi]
MSDIHSLARSRQIGWAVGSAGSTTILYVLNVILMFYMVTALGLDPILAGSFMLAGRVYDAAVDLLVGQGSDATRSRWGRRRPWMAAGALLSTCGMALLFSGAGRAEAGGQLVLMIALLATFTGYSAFSIPSSAMPAEVTRSPEVRTGMMAWRTFFIQVASLAGGALAPAMIAWGGSSPSAFALMGYAMAAFILVTMGTAVVATAGFPEGDLAARAQRVPLALRVRTALAGFVPLFANRPFLVLLGVKFCGFIGAAALGATGLFFMRDILGRGEAGMAQFALASGIVGTLSVPAWRALARLGSKPTVCASALLLACLTSASWLFAAPDESLVLFLARGALAGFASTGTLLMTLSMLPDAISWGVERSGKRQEGLYAAFFEFFQKAAFAIAPFLVGLILQTSGYRAGAVAMQSDSALAAVRFSMALIPALAQAIGLVLILLFYDLPSRSEDALERAGAVL